MRATKQARICRPTSALRLASARFSLVYLPCVVRTAVSRARPSSVLGPVRSATVQRTAPVALVRRSLAGRALTGLSPAPLAGPIGAKAPRNTFLKVVFCHAGISASYGVSLYPIIGGGARVGWPGPCTLVRAKLNNANWFYG